MTKYFVILGCGITNLLIKSFHNRNICLKTMSSIIQIIINVPVLRLLKFQDAAKAVAFYRRVKETSKEVTQEINNMKRALDPELDGK